eukprot:scaffold13505_cov17-Tisochrysis_lutea.AAC.2
MHAITAANVHLQFQMHMRYSYTFQLAEREHVPANASKQMVQVNHGCTPECRHGCLRLPQMLNTRTTLHLCLQLEL